MSLSVSLLFLFSDLLTMKNTKMAAVPRVRINAKTIEAIVYNRAAKPPIQQIGRASCRERVLRLV